MPNAQAARYVAAASTAMLAAVGHHLAGDGGAIDGFSDERLGRRAAGPRSGAEDQPVRENGNRQGLDVVREHVVAALRERGRLGDAEQRDPGARARAEIETRVRTGLADEVDDVPMNAVLDVNGHCLFDHAS